VRLLSGLILAFAAAAVALALVVDNRSPDHPGQPEPVGTPRSFFGMVPQTLPDGSELARMGATGVGQVRLMFFLGAIQPYPGQFDFVLTDLLVAGAAANGMSVLPYVVGTPAGVDRQPDQPPTTPAARAAYAGTLAAVVARYGPEGSFWELHPELTPAPIRAWEIWNEQNVAKYWGARPDALAYAQLLASASQAIKTVDPGAEVIVGGLANVTQSNGTDIPARAYLEQLYAAGAQQSFDALAVHPYASTVEEMTAQIRMVLEVARAAGDGGLPTWITEFGWSTASSGGSAGRVVAPEEQARLLGSAYRALVEQRRRWNLRGAFWYAWRDISPAVADCQWCVGAGLIDANGLAKPVLSAYAETAL
jgi:polysaccharide biosynthesis protein PslG